MNLISWVHISKAIKDVSHCLLALPKLIMSFSLFLVKVLLSFFLFKINEE